MLIVNVGQHQRSPISAGREAPQAVAVDCTNHAMVAPRNAAPSPPAR